MRHRNGRVGAVGGEKPILQPKLSRSLKSRCWYDCLATFFSAVWTPSQTSRLQPPVTSLPLAPSLCPLPGAGAVHHTSALAGAAVSACTSQPPPLPFVLFFSRQGLFFYLCATQRIQSFLDPRERDNVGFASVGEAQSLRAAFSQRKTASVTSRVQPVKSLWPQLGRDHS